MTRDSVPPRDQIFIDFWLKAMSFLFLLKIWTKLLVNLEVKT